MASPLSPDSLRTLLRQGVVIGLALLLAGYGLLLWRQAGVHAGGADSSGYLNFARMLSEGRLSVAPRVLPGLPVNAAPPRAYAPLGLLPSLEEETLVPSYPSGLPLLFAAASALVGWEHGPTVVLVGHALAGLALLYGLARVAGLDRLAAGGAALALGASPLYLMFSLQAMSDVPALVWSTAAVLLAWRAARHPGFAWAAGIVLGGAVLLRPTCLLMLLPVGVALGTSWRSWLGLLLGGLPAALWQLSLHQALYGHPLLTGYGSQQELLSLQWVPLSLQSYARWLPALLSPLVILALGLLWPGHLERRLRGVLVSWIAASCGFYAFYYHTHETWWYLRFILPAFPAIILAALLTGRRLATRLPVRWPRWAAVASVALVLANAIAWNRHWHVLATGAHEENYPRLAKWVGTHLPADSVVLAMQASGAIFYYTDRTVVRWDLLASRWQEIRTAARQAGRPVYAALFPFEVAPALEESAPGTWTQLSEINGMTIWRLEPDP